MGRFPSYHVGALLSGQRGPGLVNNHDMNAVMHAARGGNVQFFDWFYERAHPIAEQGFLWDQKNDAKSNMLSMVNQKAFVFHPERCSDGWSDGSLYRTYSSAIIIHDSCL